MSTRRDVIRAGLGATALAALHRTRAAESHPKSMLILGGTGFIGPHLTTAALAAGWKVTHFNRGKRDADGVAGVETLHGDRRGQLDALRDRRWDVVIDNTGYIPKYVQQSAQLLAPNTGYCLFVSSISAYAGFAQPNDESSPTGKLADADEEKITNETYGPMKALCEQYTAQAWQGRAGIVRPGYIVGPLDPTDRFTYWPVRAARGGEMLAPGTPQDPVQFIDVRDLVAFMLTLVARRVTGTYNVVTRPREYSIGDLVGASLSATPGAGTTVTWVPESFLFAQWKPAEVDVPPWSPMSGDSAGASLTSTDRARAAGLATRPLAETVRDTLAWYRTLPDERQAKLKAGIDPAIEAATLAAWHKV
ncbi:MAG: NAD-dependent epimerase/dehydratase family protein [Steroidobacteraceae bacterium]